MSSPEKVEGQLYKQLSAELGKQDGIVIDGSVDMEPIKKIFTEAKKEFPTVLQAQQYAKKLYPRRNFDLNTIKKHNRYILTQCLLKLVDIWGAKWLGPVDKIQLFGENKPE
jgi:hypothetical protein